MSTQSREPHFPSFPCFSVSCVLAPSCPHEALAVACGDLRPSARGGALLSDRRAEVSGPCGVLLGEVWSARS